MYLSKVESKDQIGKEASSRSRINVPGVLLGVNTHGSVFEHGDTPGQVGDHLGRQLTFAGDGSRKFAGVLLDVLDMGLEFSAKFLQVLNDGSLDSLGQVGVSVGD